MTDILDRTKIYVDGAWIESTGSGRIDVLNPATEELIGTVAEGTVEDVDAAAKAARVDGHRKLPTGGHLWRILWPWFLPAYGQIVPHLL